MDARIKSGHDERVLALLPPLPLWERLKEGSALILLSVIAGLDPAIHSIGASAS